MYGQHSWRRHHIHHAQAEQVLQKLTGSFHACAAAGKVVEQLQVDLRSIHLKQYSNTILTASIHDATKLFTERAARGAGSLFQNS
jgi:hypothetical protein